MLLKGSNSRLAETQLLSEPPQGNGSRVAYHTTNTINNTSNEEVNGRNDGELLITRGKARLTKRGKEGSGQLCLIVRVRTHIFPTK